MPDAGWVGGKWGLLGLMQYMGWGLRDWGLGDRYFGVGTANNMINSK